MRFWLLLPGVLAALMSAGSSYGGGLGAAAGHPCVGPEWAVGLSDGQRVDAANEPSAAGVWIDEQRLFWPGRERRTDRRWRLVTAPEGGMSVALGAVAQGVDRAWPLSASSPSSEPMSLTASERRRLGYLGDGLVLQVDRASVSAALDAMQTPRDDLQLWRAWHRQALLAQVYVVEEDLAGRVVAAARLQRAGQLDALYAERAQSQVLGVQFARGTPRGTRFALWAPTARAVSLCWVRRPDATPEVLQAMRFDAESGVWQLELPQRRHGGYYRYGVDVWLEGQGWVKQWVTDPYSVSLSADSRWSMALDMAAPEATPAGWHHDRAPQKVQHPVDQVIYELHVRDFSMADERVPAAHRGRYLAMTAPNSWGVRHLKALAAAGVTDVHLLPVFDFSTVSETNCQPNRQTPAESSLGAARALLATQQANDCYNWGYDPWHFNAPEGSYATDARDGAVRVREFRRMVMALHALGLRVGMDVVYNHTSAAGQLPGACLTLGVEAKSQLGEESFDRFCRSIVDTMDQKSEQKWTGEVGLQPTLLKSDRLLASVLDRIVPGYYQRLSPTGQLETSTCCANTATEHRMMAKLLIDSVLHWSEHYHISAFRFDLMGHQPKSVMVELQAALQARAQGRRGERVDLIGEGWNFGEVQDGRRFDQAAQGVLNGTGIGTFNDRLRDVLTGGNATDDLNTAVRSAGLLKGAQAQRPGDRPWPDLILGLKTGLAGSLLTAEAPSQGAYASQPSEVVNYSENHDNWTLFDRLALKLPATTTLRERVRLQNLAHAIVLLSQGIPYFHAGQDILRSKSLDRNSYDSGDAFNRIDWQLRRHGFGLGLPLAANAEQQAQEDPVLAPLLQNPALRPGSNELRWARDVFQDWLRIRASVPQLRWRDADTIRRGLQWLAPKDGPDEKGPDDVVVALLDGQAQAGQAQARSDAQPARALYAINLGAQERRVTHPVLGDRSWCWHPVLARRWADGSGREPAARWSPELGEMVVPPYAAVLMVDDKRMCHAMR